MMEFVVTSVLMAVLVIVVVMELPFLRNVLLIMLNVGVIPPQVTTTAATSVTATSATLNANLVSTGAPIKEHPGYISCEVWFEWDETTSYGYSTLKQSKSSTGSFSASITGLKPGKIYHFRAVASNSRGIDHGADTTFVTESRASSGVEIYAFYQNPVGRDEGNEWVTLYNPTNESVDIGNWVLETADGERETIPEGTILHTGAYYDYTHLISGLITAMKR